MTDDTDLELEAACCAHIEEFFDNWIKELKQSDDAMEDDTEKPTSKDLDKTPFTDDSIMPFGKYRGQKMHQLEDDYLYWLFNEPWLSTSFPAIYDYCETRLEGYNEESKEDYYEEY